MLWTAYAQDQRYVEVFGKVEAPNATIALAQSRYLWAARAAGRCFAITSGEPPRARDREAMTSPATRKEYYAALARQNSAWFAEYKAKVREAEKAARTPARFDEAVDVDEIEVGR